MWALFWSDRVAEVRIDVQWNLLCRTCAIRKFCEIDSGNLICLMSILLGALNLMASFLRIY